MRLIKGFFSNIHRYVLWLLISVFLCAAVFVLAADAPRDKKVTVFIDAEVNDRLLEYELIKELPEGIRTVKVHPFSYSAFDTGAPLSADIYILTARDLEENAEMMLPIREAGLGEDLVIDPSGLGVLIYSSDTQSGSLRDYIDYTADGDTQSFYLCFNKDSVHLGGINGSKDGAAIEIARKMISLP